MISIEIFSLKCVTMEGNVWNEKGTSVVLIMTRKQKNVLKQKIPERAQESLFTIRCIYRANTFISPSLPALSMQRNFQWQIFTELEKDNFTSFYNLLYCACVCEKVALGDNNNYTANNIALIKRIVYLQLFSDKIDSFSNFLFDSSQI